MKLFENNADIDIDIQTNNKMLTFVQTSAKKTNKKTVKYNLAHCII